MGLGAEMLEEGNIKLGKNSKYLDAGRVNAGKVDAGIG